MARTEARIHTSIWRDPDWRSLSVHAQWLYELLLSQPTVSFCGVLGLMPTRWAKMAKGMTAEVILDHLAELEGERYVVVDHDTEEVWIRSFVKWDGVLDQPGLTTAMMKDYGAIQSEPIRDGFLDGLGDGFLDGLAERFPKAFGGPKARAIPDGFADGFRVRMHARVASAQVPLSPTPAPTPSSSSIPCAEESHPNRKPAEPAVVEEEEDPDPIGKACLIVAERRFRSRQGEPITNKSGWLKRVAADVRETLNGTAAVMVAEGLSAEAIADRIDPPANSSSVPYPYESFDEPRKPKWVESIGPDGKLVVTEA